MKIPLFSVGNWQVGVCSFDESIGMQWLGAAAGQIKKYGYLLMAAWMAAPVRAETVCLQLGVRGTEEAGTTAYESCVDFEHTFEETVNFYRESVPKMGAILIPVLKGPWVNETVTPICSVYLSKLILRLRSGLVASLYPQTYQENIRLVRDACEWESGLQEAKVFRFFVYLSGYLASVASLCGCARSIMRHLPDQQRSSGRKVAALSGLFVIVAFIGLAFPAVEGEDVLRSMGLSMLPSTIAGSGLAIWARYQRSRLGSESQALLEPALPAASGP